MDELSELTGIALLDQPSDDDTSSPEGTKVSTESEYFQTEKVEPVFFEETSGENKYLRDYFDYLSQTHGLVTSGAVVEELQKYVDKMAKGSTATEWVKRAKNYDSSVTAPKVVIVTNGMSSNAFVADDLHIFIHLKMIKDLKNIDQVGKVMAHEFNHLINQTRQVKEKKRKGLGQTAVRWSHELASDFTLNLLQDAGLNTIEGSKLFETLGNLDGSITSYYQSGAFRDSADFALLTQLHSSTSDKPPTEKPDFILEAEKNIKPTPLEIMMLFCELGQIDSIRSALPQLHPYDFFQFMNSYEHSQDSEQRQEVAEVLNQELLARIKKSGAWDPSYFILCLKNNFAVNRYYFVDNLEQMESICAIFFPNSHEQRTELEANFISATEKIFGPLVTLDIYSLKDSFLNNLMKKMVPEEVDSESSFKVSEDEFLAYVSPKRDQSPTLAKSSRSFGFNVKHNIDFLTSYVQKRFTIDDGTTSTIDVAGLRSFFISLKNKGLYYTEQELELMYDFTTSSLNLSTGLSGKNLENKEVLKELFFEILVKKEEVDITGFLMDYKAEMLRLMDGYKLYFDQESKIPRIARVVEDIYHFRHKNKLRPEQVTFLYQEVFSIIDQNFKLPAGEKISVEDFLLGNSPPDQVKQSQADNLAIPGEAFAKFQLKLATLVSGFKEDSEEFYELIKPLLEEWAEVFSTLSFVQKANFLALLVQSGQTETRKGSSLRVDRILFQFYNGEHQPDVLQQVVKIRNVDKFTNLPLMKELLADIPPALEIHSWDNLVKQKEEYLSQFHACYLDKNNIKDGWFESATSLFAGPFDMSFAAYILQQPIREALVQQADRSFSLTEVQQMIDVVDAFVPDSFRKRRIIENAIKKYILSNEVTLQQKFDFLEKNLVFVSGGEALELAKQIRLRKDFQKLRSIIGDKLSKLISGDFTDQLEAGYVADSLSDIFFGEYNTMLIDSIDEEQSAEFSHHLAELYSQSLVSIGGVSVDTGLVFDEDKATFSAEDEISSTNFRSLRDFFDFLQSMSAGEKAVAFAKYLVGKTGVLTKQGSSRNSFADTILKRLKTPPGLVADLVSLAIKTTTSRLIAPPLVQSLSERLFSAVDRSKLDPTQLKNSSFKINTYSTRTLGEITKNLDWATFIVKTSDEVLEEGGYFAAATNPDIQAIIKERTVNRRHFLDTIEDKYAVLPKNFEQDFLAEKENSGYDSLIKAAQMMPISVRVMQLLSQLVPFENKDLEKKMAQSKDNNPGMNELVFWENLEKFCDSDPALMEFLDAHDFVLGKKIGAGSLFTTFEGTIQLDDKTMEIVIQMENPNAAAMVGQQYEEGHRILDSYQERFPTESSKHSAMIELIRGLLDFAQSWSLKNLHDKDYQENVEHFEKLVALYNQKNGPQEVYVPKLIWPQNGSSGLGKVRIFEKAPGKTVNQILSDKTVPEEIKTKIKQKAFDFYRFQLRTPVAYRGEMKNIIASDPHDGNALVDITDPNLTLHIIDLDMMLITNPDTSTPFDLLMDVKMDKLKLIKIFSELMDEVLESTVKERKFWLKQLTKVKVVRSFLKNYKVMTEGITPSPQLILQAFNSALREHKILLSLDQMLLIRNSFDKRMSLLPSSTSS